MIMVYNTEPKTNRENIITYLTLITIISPEMAHKYKDKEPNFRKLFHGLTYPWTNPNIKFFEMKRAKIAMNTMHLVPTVSKTMLMSCFGALWLRLELKTLCFVSLLEQNLIASVDKRWIFVDKRWIFI